MARKKIVAGNWKMNMTPSQAVKLVEELGGEVVSINFAIELTGLNGRENFKEYNVESLVEYEF